eukprot:TRINITY_DN17885_c0_g1_i1.p1 TRINITY_DN17885_c0_g1~~TRINITY_DN17885_c0_g1_i1.p1  ORF type:complete len:237 (-),score=45.00 TRINITY_DN17885_c0_g1_i1:158-844(-)
MHLSPTVMCGMTTSVLLLLVCSFATCTATTHHPSTVDISPSSSGASAPSPPTFPDKYIYAFHFDAGPGQYGESVGFYDWPNQMQRVKDVYYPNITESIYDSVIWGPSGNGVYMWLENATESCLIIQWTPQMPPNVISTNGTYNGTAMVNGAVADVWNIDWHGELVQYYFDSAGNWVKGWFFSIDQGFYVHSITSQQEIPSEFFAPDPYLNCTVPPPHLEGKMPLFRAF